MHGTRLTSFLGFMFLALMASPLTAGEIGPYDRETDEEYIVDHLHAVKPGVLFYDKSLHFSEGGSFVIQKGSVKIKMIHESKNSVTLDAGTEIVAAGLHPGRRKLNIETAGPIIVAGTISLPGVLFSVGGIIEISCGSLNIVATGAMRVDASNLGSRGGDIDIVAEILGTRSFVKNDGSISANASSPRGGNKPAPKAGSIRIRSGGDIGNSGIISASHVSSGTGHPGEINIKACWVENIGSIFTTNSGMSDHTDFDSGQVGITLDAFRFLNGVSGVISAVSERGATRGAWITLSAGDEGFINLGTITTDVSDKVVPGDASSGWSENYFPEVGTMRISTSGMFTNGPGARISSCLIEGRCGGAKPRVEVRATWGVSNAGMILCESRATDTVKDSICNRAPFGGTIILNAGFGEFKNVIGGRISANSMSCDGGEIEIKTGDPKTISSEGAISADSLSSDSDQACGGEIKMSTKGEIIIRGALTARMVNFPLVNPGRIVLHSVSRDISGATIVPEPEIGLPPGLEDIKPPDLFTFRIACSPVPEEGGVSHICGTPDAVIDDFSRRLRLTLKNLRTGVIVAAISNDDGSFKAELQCSPGDRISVTAMDSVNRETTVILDPVPQGEQDSSPPRMDEDAVWTYGFPEYLDFLAFDGTITDQTFPVKMEFINLRTGLIIQKENRDFRGSFSAQVPGQTGDTIRINLVDEVGNFTSVYFYWHVPPPPPEYCTPEFHNKIRKKVVDAFNTMLREGLVRTTPEGGIVPNFAGTSDLKAKKEAINAALRRMIDSIKSELGDHTREKAHPIPAVVGKTPVVVEILKDGEPGRLERGGENKKVRNGSAGESVDRKNETPNSVHVVVGGNGGSGHNAGPGEGRGGDGASGGTVNMTAGASGQWNAGFGGQGGAGGNGAPGANGGNGGSGGGGSASNGFASGSTSGTGGGGGGGGTGVCNEGNHNGQGGTGGNGTATQTSPQGDGRSAMGNGGQGGTGGDARNDTGGRGGDSGRGTGVFNPPGPSTGTGNGCTGVGVGPNGGPSGVTGPGFSPPPASAGGQGTANMPQGAGNQQYASSGLPGAQR